MSGELFEGVLYYVVEDNVKCTAEVKQLLKEGGASREFYYSELVTHVISDGPVSTSSEGIPEDFNKQIVVHSDWVKMSVKCEAQLPLAPFQVSLEKLFSNLIFCPSKLSSSDSEKLCVLVLYYGGKMQRQLDSKVTHLIAAQARGIKYEHAKKHSEIEVMTPHWVLDCIRHDQLLPTDRYHPALLKSNPSPTRACNGAADPEPSCLSMPISISNSVLGPRVPGAAGGGSSAVAETPSEESVELKGKFSVDGGGMPRAVERVPEPSGSVESLQVANIGVQAARNEAMVSVDSGAVSERLLEGIVICFIDYQECVEDDTLEKWKLVVEQHGGKVLDCYDPHRCTHLLALHKKSDIFSQVLHDGKCIASAHWLNDVLTDQKMFPPRNPIHFPTAFKWQFPGAEQFSMTLTNYTDSERELVKDMLRICGITYTGHLTRNNTHLICKRGEGKKYEMAQQWGVQIVNSRFLAHIIHEGEPPPVLTSHYTSLDQPDEFSSDSSTNAALLLDTWKRFMEQYSQSHHTSLLANPPRVEATPSDSAHQGRKRRRSTRLDQSCESTGEHGGRKSGRKVPVVLFTGIGLSAVKKLKQIVGRLGGRVTEVGKECTHLVSPRITRTVKFLSAISVCRCVVTPDWVEECGRQRSFIREDSFALQDNESEKMFGMKLSDSLQRARQKKLLEGVCICPTQAVQPPFESMKEIVESAGGEVLTVEEARSVFLEDGGNPGERKLVVLSSPADIDAGRCRDFIEWGAEVCNAELVLTGVLHQTLNYEVYSFILEQK